MNTPYQLALHIFRRDLRLPDNMGLIAALKSSRRVIPCFILDPRQIDHNPYKSDHSLQFMARCIQELDQALQQQNGRLYIFYGVAEEVVADLIKQQPIDAVFINRDYTPFSQTRDEKMAQLLADKNIAFHAYADALLHEPEEVLKSNQEPYTIFTPFFRSAKQLHVKVPEKNPHQNFHVEPILLEQPNQLNKLTKLQNPNLLVKGGRSEALLLLKRIHTLENYAVTRNYPAEDSTTHLSAHNKFGTLSIRELYKTITQHFGNEHTLMNELYWRDFFTHIGAHFPRVFKQAFQKKYVDIAWETNPTYFARWCEGTTGFPIVDAGMRELNATGYMHNRVRMIVASFLTKDLHIHWQLGERYFANRLVDYDPAVNNGNWQWAASTGCDAQPYFRIFNPWLQQKKFDADCAYIKKWLPELASQLTSTIHSLYKTTIAGYPAPMVDHGIQSQRGKMMFKDALRDGRFTASSG